MVGKWLAIFGLTLVATLLLSFSGCGDPQELVSIAVQPGSETFGASNIPVSQNAGAQVQLKAFGTYVHPPVTKDITAQVTWSSNSPQMVTVNSTGLITVTGNACGGSIVSATVQTNADTSGVSSSGAIVTGSMTANVVCFTGTGPTVTIDFAGTGTGTISSSPAGLGCSATPGSSCTGSFPIGTNVTLTAVPNGTFAGWAGCDIESGTTCTIQNLTNNVTVTATFN
jgi:Bacterial Ig-like domain (group 2)